MKQIILIWTVMFLACWFSMYCLLGDQGNVFTAGILALAVVGFFAVSIYGDRGASSLGSSRRSSADSDLPIGMPPKPGDFSGDNSDWANTVDMLDNDDR